MKAYLEFDLDHPSGRDDLIRAANADRMALALHRIRHNMNEMLKMRKAITVDDFCALLVYTDTQIEMAGC